MKQNQAASDGRHSYFSTCESAPLLLIMFSIGEFSKITGLTIKTLRFYHQQGVLVPSSVDDQTGYRYYDESKSETARIIAQLRKLEFSLSDIAEILEKYDDESDMLHFMERQRTVIEAQRQHLQSVVQSLDQLIQRETEARQIMQTSNYEIQEKTVEPLLVAGVRIRGKYSDCGRGFAKIGRACGRYICGKPLLLIHDTEYKEGDADFEACLPVRAGKSNGDVVVREIPGGKCVSLLHRGPYQQLSRSYERVLKHIKQQGYEIEIPCREVYLKGPGMIFKGNPKKYLTEIQMLIK